MANLVNEAQCLANTAHLTSNGLSLVKFFDGRPASEVRLLAEELRKIFHGLACLFTFDESKLTAIVISGDQSLQSARTILNHWLSPIQGKGGGDDKMAQGGAKMTQESYQEFIRQLKDGFQPGRD